MYVLPPALHLGGCGHFITVRVPRRADGREERLPCGSHLNHAWRSGHVVGKTTRQYVGVAAQDSPCPKYQGQRRLVLRFNGNALTPYRPADEWIRVLFTFMYRINGASKLFRSCHGKTSCAVGIFPYKTWCPAILIWTHRHF